MVHCIRVQVTLQVLMIFKSFNSSIQYAMISKKQTKHICLCQCLKITQFLYTCTKILDQVVASKLYTTLLNLDFWQKFKNKIFKDHWKTLKSLKTRALKIYWLYMVASCWSHLVTWVKCCCKEINAQTILWDNMIDLRVNISPVSK